MSGPIPIEQLEQGQYQFPPFPPAVREQIRQIQDAFSDVCPDGVAEWEDGFRRDAHPLREIELWLAMAGVYRRFAGRGEASAAHNKDIFRVLLSASFAGADADAILETAQAPTLSRQQVEAIVAAFGEAMAGH